MNFTDLQPIPANTTNSSPKTPEYLNEQQVSAMTGISLSKLRNDRFYRQGLPYYKVGKSVRYGYDDVKQFMESCKISFEG